MSNLKNIIIYPVNTWKFDFFHEKQIEFYADEIPQTKIPEGTIRIVCLWEPSDIKNLAQAAVNGYNNKTYNYLMTHNEDLLKIIPKSYLFEIGTTWIHNYKFPEKEFSVSTLVGSKLMAPGHELRQKLWFKENRIKKILTKFFLSGNDGRIENYNNNPTLGDSKFPLFDSQFHVCIENTKRNNWFTEKLIDCLQTKTVPIYWGCPNIGNWFNTKGFIMVDNLEDIVSACNSLNENTYKEKLEFIEENFEKSKSFCTIIDRFQGKIGDILKENNE